MKRIVTFASLVVLALAAVGLAACSGPAEEAEEDMGVWGYVASAEDAQLEVEESQPGGDEIVVDRVKAPGPAWLVVHLEVDGKPGDRVGLEHIDEGESRDIAIELEDVDTENVIVAVHADRDVENSFDFDMMEAEASPDRPYFVDGKELAVVVAVD